MQIGRRVAKLREAHGESLREAAIRTGVSHTTIARIEKGDVIGSFQSTLRKIAEGYGVRVEFLLGNRDPRQEFLFALHRLSQTERARLYFIPVRTRIRMVLDFLTSEFPAEFTVDQLAGAMEMAPERLRAVLETEVTTDQPTAADQHIARSLSRMTGIPMPWFTSGAASGEASEAMPVENAGEFITLMKKAANAGLPPAELEMAIDLLIMKEKGPRT